MPILRYLDMSGKGEGEWYREGYFNCQEYFLSF